MEIKFLSISQKLLGGSLFLLGLLLVCRPLSVPDLFWQMEQGKQWLAHGVVESSPPFAFGCAHQPYLREYLIFGGFFYFVQITLGTLGLFVAFAAVNATPFLCAFASIIRQGRKLWEAGVLLPCLAFYFIFDRIQARPESCGVAMLAGMGFWLIHSAKKEWRWRQGLWIGVFFAFWANIHATYLVGLMVLAIDCGEQVWLGSSRQSGFLGKPILLWMSALLGTLVNPDGFWRWSGPVYNQVDYWSNANSFEMQPLDFSQWGYYAASSSYFGWLYWQEKRKPPFFVLFVHGIFLLMTLKVQRYTGMYGITFLWLYVSQEKKSEKSTKLAWTYGGMLIRLIIALEVIVLFISVLKSKVDRVRSGKNILLEEERFSVKTVDEISSFELLRPTLFAEVCVESYAAGRGKEPIFVLNDSGQARYSDEARRYYYYLYNHADAFNDELKYANLDFLIVNWNSAHWMPLLQSSQRWHLVGAASDGLLFSTHNFMEKDEALRSGFAVEYVRRAAKEGRLLCAFFMGDGIIDDKERLRYLYENKNWNGSRMVSDNYWFFLRQALDRIPEETFINMERNPAWNDNPYARLFAVIRRQDWVSAAAVLDHEVPVGEMNPVVAAWIYSLAGRREGASKVISGWHHQNQYDAGLAELKLYFPEIKTQFDGKEKISKNIFAPLQYSKENRSWFVSYAMELNARIATAKISK